MTWVNPIEIPQSHIDFANSVADLAEKNNIQEFTIGYEPDRHNEDSRWDRRVRGTATIHFKAKDGRGRPCRSLEIRFEASHTHVIEYNEPSSN
jgi:hypothetical protein